MSGHPNDQSNPASAIPVYMAVAPTTTYTPLGYQQITSLSTAQTLTIPAGATFAILEAEAQAVRYRDDGVAPTTSVGMVLPVSAQIAYSGPLASIQFIQAASGAILNVSYYK